MAAGEHSHRPHEVVYISQINANGQRCEVGVGPKLDVLMPFDLLASARPFEVELGVVISDRPTQNGTRQCRP